MSLRVSEHVDFGFATFLFHDSESLKRFTGEKRRGSITGETI